MATTAGAAAGAFTTGVGADAADGTTERRADDPFLIVASANFSAKGFAETASNALTGTNF